MDYELKIREANEAAEFFNQRIAEIFPNAAVAKAVLSGNLADAIYFRIAVDNFQVTINNARTYTLASMFITNQLRQVYSKYSIEVLSMKYLLKEAGVKFRRIEAKTPMQAVIKLLAWFEKNKELYIQVATNS